MLLLISWYVHVYVDRYPTKIERFCWSLLMKDVRKGRCFTYMGIGLPVQVQNHIGRVYIGNSWLMYPGYQGRFPITVENHDQNRKDVNHGWCILSMGRSSSTVESSFVRVYIPMSCPRVLGSLFKYDLKPCYCGL